MPEPETLFRRKGLRNDYAINLPIVLDDWRKLPNRHTSAHAPLQGIENIFKPIIHVVDLQCTPLQIQLHVNRQLRLSPIFHTLFFRGL